MNYLKSLLFWIITVLTGSFVLSLISTLIERSGKVGLNSSFIENLFGLTWMMSIYSAICSIPTLLILWTVLFYQTKKGDKIKTKRMLNMVHIICSAVTFAALIILTSGGYFSLKSLFQFLTMFVVYAGIGQFFWNNLIKIEKVSFIDV